MDKRIFMLVVYITLLGQGLAQGPLTLSVVDDALGTELFSPAEILETRAVKFTCSFSQITLGVGEISRIHLQAKVDNVWQSQAFCIYRRPVSDVEVSPAVTSDHTVDILTEQISCSSLLDKAEFTLEKPLSLSYRCDYEDVYPGSGPAVKSTEFVLETYSMPSKPIIHMDPTKLYEGDAVSFECTSEARPVPVLSFKLGGVLQKSSTVGDSTPSDEPQQGSVVWNTTANRLMHLKELRCEVDNNQHPYKGEIETTRRPMVIYGPDESQTPEPAVDLNIRSGDSVTLTCSMDGYPMEYKWEMDPPVTGADLVVEATSYKIASIGSYTCVGTNSDTGNSATKIYKINFTDGPHTTASSSGQNIDGETEATGLQGGEIAGIVVGVIVLVLIIIVIIVCVVKKRNSSSSQAEKAKAAQARKASDDRTDDTRFQSNASIHGTGNNPMDRTTYTENATLQMENRYPSSSDLLNIHSSAVDN